MVCHSYILICHPYVTRIYSHVIRMPFVCSRMSFACHSYVLVCHVYVTSMYSYVIRMSLVCHPYVTLMCSYVIRVSLVCTPMLSVCGFTMNPLILFILDLFLKFFIFQDLKSLVIWQTVIWVSHSCCGHNNLLAFHLWWRETMLEEEKVSKDFVMG